MSSITPDDKVRTIDHTFATVNPLLGETSNLVSIDFSKKITSPRFVSPLDRSIEHSAERGAMLNGIANRTSSTG